MQIAAGSKDDTTDRVKRGIEAIERRKKICETRSKQRKRMQDYQTEQAKGGKNKAARAHIKRQQSRRREPNRAEKRTQD